MSILTGLTTKIRNKIASTRSKLDETLIEKEHFGFKVVVTAAKNVKSVNIPEEFVGRMDDLKVNAKLVHAINLALKDAEDIAVTELKTAGDTIIPGFAKIFNRRKSSK